MNKAELLGYLERLDHALKTESTLHIYGSAAFMLLDEPDRTSLDVDVAAPYSMVDVGDLRQAAVDIVAVAEAVAALPAPFNRDALVLENLENLRVDITLWLGDAQ